VIFLCGFVPLCELILVPAEGRAASSVAERQLSVGNRCKSFSDRGLSASVRGQEEPLVGEISLDNQYGNSYDIETTE
jgi:hypothetical protein